MQQEYILKRENINIKMGEGNGGGVTSQSVLLMNSVGNTEHSTASLENHENCIDLKQGWGKLTEELEQQQMIW